MNTQKQKIISFLISLIIIFSSFAFADEVLPENSEIVQNEKTITLRIEGISENKLYEKNKIITYETEKLTVTDVLKSLLSEENYIYETGEYGGYFSSLFGETEKTFDYDYDGWQFMINGEKTSVGVDACEVNDNDEILFYYGPMSIAYPNTPVITYHNNGIEIAFNYEKTTYDAEWNATVETVPLDNLKVTWYYQNESSAEFITDANGKILIPLSQAEAGMHKIQIDKRGEAEKDGSFVPLVVRFAPDYEVEIKEPNQKTVNLRIEGISENRVYEKEKAIAYYSEKLTVADVIKSVLSEENYIYETGEYGGYFSSLFGEAEKTFDYDYDGWQFRINGEKASVGVDSCEVNDNDKILFYYGPMSIAYPNSPVITYKNSGFEVSFTYEKTTYDEEWNATVVTAPLENADITWYYSTDNTQNFTTDENGKIFVPLAQAEAGMHKIQIDKRGEAEKDGSFVPLVVRFAPDFCVSVPVIQQPSSSGSGSGYIQSLKEQNQKHEESKNEEIKEKEEQEEPKKEENEESEDSEEKTAFTDIKNHWAESYIKKLSASGYINGKTKETFAPEAFISRAECMAILYRMSEDSDFERKEAFDDVSENDWFFEAVCWAKEKGLINGTSDNSFSPFDNITREQLAVICAKYISYKNLEFLSTKDIKKFSDEAEISSWAYDYAVVLAEFGILSGNENGAFMPKNNTKRAEAAKILSYLIKK